MNAATLFLISLILSLVLGFTTKVNTGYYAMAFAFLNGVFIYDMAVKKIAATWPIYCYAVLWFCAFKWNADKNGRENHL